jgi:3-polyprenyl-4-hydroxybenzoate decarboxylase
LVGQNTTIISPMCIFWYLEANNYENIVSEWVHKKSGSLKLEEKQSQDFGPYPIRRMFPKERNR